MKPVTDASAWTGCDRQHDTSWEFELSPPQQDDLLQALRRVTDHQLQLAEITRENFPLP